MDDSKSEPTSSADDDLLMLVQQHLEPLKTDKPQLSLLIEDSLRLHATAEQLTQRVLKDHPSEEIESLQRVSLILLKHEIRLLLEEKESVEKKTEHMIHFLEDDVRSCLEQASTKAVEEKIRDAKQLAALAQETSQELHKQLFKTQKEITAPESHMESPVRQALISQIGKFDTDYSATSTLRWLRNQLGISLVSTVEKRMKDRLEELVSAFQKQQRTEAEQSECVAQITKKIRSLQAKAEAHVRKEFPNVQLQELIIAEVKTIADALLEEGSLQELLR
jgi:hypothetical protein